MRSKARSRQAIQGVALADAHDSGLTFSVPCSPTAPTMAELHWGCSSRRWDCLSACLCQPPMSAACGAAVENVLTELLSPTRYVTVYHQPADDWLVITGAACAFQYVPD